MKNPTLKTLLAWSFVLSTLVSCQKANDSFNIDKEKQLVENAIHNSIGWAKNKDIGLLYSVIANDSNYIEVDPGDRIV